MKPEGGNTLDKAGLNSAIIACLDAIPCDEIVEFDLINNRCRNLKHTEGKFFVPILDSSLDAMQRFAPEGMVHPDDRGRILDFLLLENMIDRLNSAKVPGMLQTEVRYKTLEGEFRWTRLILAGGEASGLPRGIARMYIYDIQEEKNAVPVFQTRGQIHRDERTGLLLDRDLFAMTRERMNSMRGQWCVIAIDIEHFKLFSDWHGKDAADMLLVQISKLLQQLEIDTHGLAGYRGLDDFWLVIPYDQRLIEALYNQIRDLIISHGNSVGFLPIFGIALMSGGDEEVSDLFNHAALTAEQIKGDLHNRIRIYNPTAYLKTAEEYRLLTDFQRGLENHEVFFCLQPQCRVSTGAVVGAESLARWRLRDGTMVPPTRFVPILEKYGMVTNLDKYIWEMVCAWLRRWIDEGHTPIPISVNISPSDFLTVDVPAYFEKLLKQYDIPAHLLKAEITETAYVEDTATVRDTVRRLRAMGHTVLMDDFGSGYSSLNMLRSLNVDIIKLDAQFLHINAHEERKGISILESIVNMAQSMSLPIIVEGVETQEQINFLSDIGCRYMQGYYFYRAMPLEEFERLISDPRNIDLRGFEFKAADQIHPREFLDENVFSDAMLNNILGPVAIYRWSGDKVDIIRYNQQFYQMVGIEIDQLDKRRSSIADYFYPEDRVKMTHMLETAARDRLNGSRGVVRVYRPNGTLRWISVQLYYLSDTPEGKTFYASCEDVTELQFINVDLPGGYHRCSVDNGYELRYVSKNFLEMTGYTARELKADFDNKLINMMHPDDVPLVNGMTEALLKQQKPKQEPFRLRHKEKGYIYVVSQQIITDLYGEICYMAVANDVTDIVKMRNNMRLLEMYSTDCIAFVRHVGTRWDYDVIVYGLEGALGMSQSQFLKALRTGSLYAMVEESQRKEIQQRILQSMPDGQSLVLGFELKLPTGEARTVRIKADRVQHGEDHVEYIFVFRVD